MKESSAREIGAEMGKKANAVYEKAKRLGLRVIIFRKSQKITSSDLGSRALNVATHGGECYIGRG